MNSLDTLDSFNVRFEFRQNETTWTVCAGKMDEPLARLHKQGAVNSIKPYEVYGGPGLDELLGRVAISIALGPDGTRLGTVSRRAQDGLEGGPLTDEEWTFTQEGLGALRGTPLGLGSRARHTYVVSNVIDNGLTDVLLEHRLRYRAPDSEGFELTRRSGVRSRYDVRIHDPRVSRLLVLAAVAYFDEEHGDIDIRKLLPSIAGLFRH
ncbi:hypothetical protein [Streptacidiphilus carbonis]|uniref:hypothetical protein n=1 Tax=Streptacidiphilus carbonis TaxID=105422 RepID=UPI0005A92CBE|nr:hypothetical protein [Streptacidiphilus carbonis]